MIPTNVHHLVQRAAMVCPDAPAITFKSTTLSYGELWEQSCRLAGAFHEVGVARGDRIAIYTDKRPEAVVSILGASAAGAVFVPINPMLRPHQVGHIVADSGAKVLVTSIHRSVQLRDELSACPSLERLVLIGSAETGTAPSAREYDWSSLMMAEPIVTEPIPAVDVDIAAIFYTSGSTGRPKGVVLSHRNLIVGAQSVSEYIGNTSDDVILSALPLSFDAGFSQLTTAFNVGAHVILMNYLLPADVVKLCVKHGVTGLTCVPPLWIQIADLDWPKEAADRLRYFANTGGRIPKTTLDRLRSNFPLARPFLMYGLTEAFRSTYLDPAEVDRRPDSIGKAIPNAEILVVRSDGTLCGPGEEGELVHRGALVALGYWKDEERTRERFKPVPGADASTWRSPELAVWSGDVVRSDEEGFLYFVGRRDEMIKTSGYRVSPSEIEEVAYATGLVRDAVAMGVEDPRLGQRILLVVSPQDPVGFNVDGLMAVMKAQLPTYMLPARIVVQAELCRSPNGKFDRVRIRDEIA